MIKTETFWIKIVLNCVCVRVRARLRACTRAKAFVSTFIQFERMDRSI